MRHKSVASSIAVRMIINGMCGVEQNVRSEIVRLECIGDVQVKDEW